MSSVAVRFAFSLLLLLLVISSEAFAGPQVLWTRQMGTAVDDTAYAVSVDATGNAYVAGTTFGGLDGNLNAGYGDIFIAKFDADGKKLWTRQMGTELNDYAKSISVDTSGNAYVVGYTEGVMDGKANAGRDDIFIVKLDTHGNRLWTRQMGTASNDSAFSIAVDASGNIYAAGHTYGGLDGNTNAGLDDVFVVKLDTDGNRIWTRQLGSAGADEANGIAVDASGNSYVVGDTYGGLDGNTNAGFSDTFVLKLDTDGNLLWTRQMDSAEPEGANSVALDSFGNAYVAGYTWGKLDGNSSAGGIDILIAKFDPAGKELWTRQMGSPADEDAKCVASDFKGNIWVASNVYGDSNMGTLAGFYVAKCDSSGRVRWMFQERTGYHNGVFAVSTDPQGNAFVAGSTTDGLDGNTNAGGYDLFIMKLADLPHVSVITPGSVSGGSAVRLDGERFGEDQGRVYVGSKKVKVTAWSDTAITFVAPTKNPAGEYPVHVVTKAGDVGPNVPLDLMAPEIKGLSASSGPARSSITLTGQYFGVKPKVTLTSAASKAIKAKVAAGFTDTGLTFAVPPVPLGTYSLRVNTFQGGSAPRDFTVTN